MRCDTRGTATEEPATKCPPENCQSDTIPSPKKEGQQPVSVASSKFKEEAENMTIATNRFSIAAGYLRM